jgi:hypothetical protein
MSQLFLMKLDAARSVDYTDMVALWPHCGFTSAEQVVELYYEAYPNAAVDEFLVEFVPALRRRARQAGRATAVRYVDEGLRMDEHPGILFREGPAGRRATVVGGPDVWEIVRDVKAARAAEPKLSEDALVSMLEDNSLSTDRQ